MTEAVVLKLSADYADSKRETAKGTGRRISKAFNTDFGVAVYVGVICVICGYLIELLGVE